MAGPSVVTHATGLTPQRFRYADFVAIRIDLDH
jgi:hypothetical protein